MKKALKLLSFAIVSLLALTSLLTLAGCDFTVKYKEYSTKLDKAILSIQQDDSFTAGTVKIGVNNYNCEVLPALSQKFANDLSASHHYKEINEIYDSAFSYTMKYIVDYAQIIDTPPTVEALTEKQENLYKGLTKKIDEFNKTREEFSKDVTLFNNYYANTSLYGQSSKEIFILNYKKSYRDLINASFSLANALEDITGSVYTEIDYTEFANKTSTVTKVFSHGINIRVFKGFFTFLVDSFDCRIPQLNVDANQYMQEVLATYNNMKALYLNYYKTMKSSSLSVSLTQAEIDSIKETISVYLAETDLYEKAYKDIGFEKFYFDDDCNLEKYVQSNYANRNRYLKINDYINNTLPAFTEFIADIFF